MRGGVTSFDGAVDFAGADGVDDHAVTAHQVEDGDVRAGLLRIADDVEGFQVVDPLDDAGGVIDVDGGAELFGELSNRNAGNFASREREGGDIRHGIK